MIKQIVFDKATYQRCWNKLVGDEELKHYKTADLLHLAAACVNGIAHAGITESVAKGKHAEHTEADVTTLHEEVFSFLNQFVALGGFIHVPCYDQMCEPQVLLGIERTDEGTHVVALKGMKRDWSEEFDRRLRGSGREPAEE